jgi:hypothetical protein
LPSWQVQEARIQELQQRLNNLVSDGYMILQADETLFNTDHHVGAHWAP